MCARQFVAGASGGAGGAREHRFTRIAALRGQLPQGANNYQVPRTPLHRASRSLLGKMHVPRHLRARALPLRKPRLVGIDTRCLNIAKHALPSSLRRGPDRLQVRGLNTAFCRILMASRGLVGRIPDRAKSWIRAPLVSASRRQGHSEARSNRSQCNPRLP